MDTNFLPLQETLLEMTFWSRMQDVKLEFVSVRNIVNMALS